MTIAVNTGLPDNVNMLLRDIDAALGDQLVGVILFGSWCNGNAGKDSDIDLAVIVADTTAEQNRQAVLRSLRSSGIDPNTLSLSIESYLRIKEFLKLGDPFAWVVCTRGKILKDRSNLLLDLQNECRVSHTPLETNTISKYLQTKSRNHFDQAMQGFQQFLANIQLSVMAGAQAVATSGTNRTIEPDEVIALSDWDNLKRFLFSASVSQEDIHKIELLINAHKHVRMDSATFAGKELMDMVKDVGEFWKKRLP